MRDKLLAAGVKHLKEFGYPTVNRENILTDYVYGKFFRKMLEGTIEDAADNRIVVAACKKLIAEIDACTKPA